MQQVSVRELDTRIIEMLRNTYKYELILSLKAHMQSGMVQSHHGTPSHPHTMMLMATQAPAGHQAALPQGTLNPIPVSSATHYSYTLTPGKSRSQINTSESERDLLQSMLTLKMYA